MTRWILPRKSHFTPLQFLTLYLHLFMISKHIIVLSFTAPGTNSGPLKPLINFAPLKKLQSWSTSNRTSRHRGHSCPPQNWRQFSYPLLPLSRPSMFAIEMTFGTTLHFLFCPYKYSSVHSVSSCLSSAPFNNSLNYPRSAYFYNSI